MQLFYRVSLSKTQVIRKKGYYV